MAAIASGAAGVLGALRSEWAALGSLAVFGAALQAFAAAREGIHQDHRNAERYDNSAQALQGLRERLDDVRQGIAAGATAVLGEYVGAVQDQLSLEHRQWLEGAENMQAAVARCAADETGDFEIRPLCSRRFPIRAPKQRREVCRAVNGDAHLALPPTSAPQ